MYENLIKLAEETRQEIIDDEKKAKVELERKVNELVYKVLEWFRKYKTRSIKLIKNDDNDYFDVCDSNSEGQCIHVQEQFEDDVVKKLCDFFGIVVHL